MKNTLIILAVTLAAIPLMAQQHVFPSSDNHPGNAHGQLNTNSPPNNSQTNSPYAATNSSPSVPNPNAPSVPNNPSGPAIPKTPAVPAPAAPGVPTVPTPSIPPTPTVPTPGAPGNPTPNSPNGPGNLNGPGGSSTNADYNRNMTNDYNAYNNVGTNSGLMRH